MKTVVLRGVVKVNFELEIDPQEFKDVCQEYNLDPKDVAKFTEEQWLLIRSSLADIVSNNESEIDCGDIYDHNLISVDEACVQTKDIITCFYETGDAVHSIEIS
jgi:hypothetical protein